MQSATESGVSVAKQGSEWKAACAADGWEKVYSSQKQANSGIGQHTRRHHKNGKNGSGTRPEAGSVPQHSGPSSDTATSFQDALQALSEAREVYERSLAAFRKMIGD